MVKSEKRCKKGEKVKKGEKKCKNGELNLFTIGDKMRFENIQNEETLKKNLRKQGALRYKNISRENNIIFT